MNLLELAEKGEFTETGETKTFSIPGQASNLYPVYAIPLKYLFYNDQNGRIITSYKKHLSENNEIEPEPGNSVYNEIFEKFIDESNSKSLKTTKESIKQKGQTEPGVVLPNGRVVDGNRRFTALRQLQREEDMQRAFHAVILPLNAEKNADKRIITELELELQFGREERITYNPIDRILHTYETIIATQKLTKEEYRDATGAGNTNGINKDLRVAELIIKFIEIVSPGGNPIDKFYLARGLDLDGPLKEIESVLNNLESKDKVAIKEASLVYIALAKTGMIDKEPVRAARELKNTILHNEEMTERFLDIMEENDRLDNIIDAFADKPLEDSNDLKLVICDNGITEKAANESISSIERLIYRGGIDNKRTKILIQLEYIREQLEELRLDDFLELKPHERIKSRDVIIEIRDILFKLEKGL